MEKLINNQDFMAGVATGLTIGFFIFLLVLFIILALADSKDKSHLPNPRFRQYGPKDFEKEEQHYKKRGGTHAP